MKKFVVSLWVMLLSIGVAGSALAVPITFFGEDAGLGDHNGKLFAHPNADAARDAFLTNLVGVGTEDFEGFARYTSAPLALNFVGAGTATLSGGGEVMDDNYGPAFSPNPEPDQEWYGQFAISGSQYFGQVSSPGLVVDLSDPVAAFGFYATDIGDFSGRLELELLGGGTTVVEIPTTLNSPGGSVIYFGLIDVDNPFTKVTFTATSGSDVYGFDDLTIGNVEQVNIIPEPGTVFLFGFGLIGLLVLGRKKLLKK